MSWFDTASFANIAKSALKEAQRTIDKALDIRDDDPNAVVPSNTPIDVNQDEFFQSWGLNTVNSNKNSPSDVVTKSPVKSQKVVSSIWGSFTGSFFENAQEKGQKSKDSIESLDDSADLDFKESKLVVQHSDDGDSMKRSLSVEETGVLDDEGKDCYDGMNLKEIGEVNALNRLSIVSNESDKKSSDSVEVLSNTECTTSPDSEMVSHQSITTTSSGIRQTTESVEVLPDSLTSPSSIEQLDSDSSNSKHLSPHTNEFLSPDDSPGIEEEVAERSSPESVQVIQEEQEDTSIAEDTISYTSISESTAATVLDSAQMLQPLNYQKSHSKDTPDIPITRPPSRTALHLPLPQTISTQPQSIKEDVNDLMLTSNIIDIPTDLESSGVDDSSQSDKTLIASDVGDSGTDTSESNYTSTYLKHMLADAMVEKSHCEHDFSHQEVQSKEDGGNYSDAVILPMVSTRELSPLSSERSDMVKIGSDQASGHTSGDELETTTSSDIEIISSPNGGDSSSTHSRHSPAKLICVKGKSVEPNVDSLLGKMTFKRNKGHNRELSEASSISEDSEMERLARRISEVTEILESREAKLIEVSRKNAELQESNEELRSQLDTIHTKQLECLDLSQVTDEYARRLSALEKKFQQAIREKDSLRKQLDECKKDATSRLTKSEIDTLVAEKDEIIKELREEGEKLSKQQLQHSNIIKKLRAKEKEHENSIKYFKETVEDLTGEVDRLKRSLTAKEEVERSQIEAVHQLTTKNKKLETELETTKDNFDDLNQKFDTVKKSLDAAKKELGDKNRTSNELIAREQLLQSLENEKRMTESQNEEIIGQLEDLRSKLRDGEENFLRKEHTMRTEINELLRRLEDAERRNEELAQSVMEVGKPLVRQLESLQATYNVKIANFEQMEQNSIVKINDLQTKLRTLTDLERIAREDSVSFKARLTEAELKLSDIKREKDLAAVQFDQKETEYILNQQKLKNEIDIFQTTLKTERELVENLRKEISSLQNNLQQIDRISNDDEKSETIQEEKQAASQIVPPRSLSPSMSISESISSSLWLPDDVFETSTSSRCTNMLEMQYIQTSLKQKDGEVQQLHWELKRREHERTLLNKEISSLISKVEQLEGKVIKHDSLQTQFDELTQQYETLCQLYGEKVEETEELKLDLVDIKEMYKSQIDDLLNQQKEK
ncbi:TATA element modulatory factor [Onthophagus taurus]|uniref:TATA element modulatory factor n=1 Tax=Onthophagus taurus TaxID=166361 RepID=UPI0039BE7C47